MNDKNSKPVSVRLRSLPLPAYNSGHTALAYAFAQIGSLRSPTSYVRKTLSEIVRISYGNCQMCGIQRIINRSIFEELL